MRSITAEDIHIVDTETEENLYCGAFLSGNKINQTMVRHIDPSWNTLEPSLRLMHEKLVELGWACFNGEILVIEPDVERIHRRVLARYSAQFIV